MHQAVTNTVSKPSPLNGLFGKVFAEILADRTTLPSLPDLALRIRAAMSHPDFELKEVARIVQTDPAVSAYLLRLANSPFYRRNVPVEDVRNAVMRLGAPVTRDLVTGYALRAMFTTPVRSLAQIMRERWRTSANVSALSSVLAARCGAFNPDRAMLAGLIQDIGALPLLQALAKRPGPLPDPARIEITLDAFSAKVGVVLLKHWGFDDAMVEVARSRCDWFRDPNPEPDLSDLVLMARLHYSIKAAGDTSLPAIYTVPAFTKLRPGKLSESSSLTILDEAQQEVSGLMKMLGV